MEVTRPDSLLNALSLDLPALDGFRVELDCGDKAARSYNVAARIAAQGLWPALRWLSLPHQQLGSFPMKPLLQTDWSQLDHSDLSDNNLNAQSLEVMVACKWPFLTSLSLRYNSLDVDDMEVLVQGKWPLLRDLDLSGNHFCEQACNHLARGAWPNLSTLQLMKCELDVCGLFQLLHGSWPDFDELSLEENHCLTIETVYEFALNVVSHANCKYAKAFNSWVDSYQDAAADPHTAMESVSLSLSMGRVT